MTRTNNQKGFTIVEVLLVIIAVTLLAGVGLYGYNSIKKENKKKDVSSKSETAKNERNTAPKKYYNFPDLGVKIILPQELEGITQQSRHIQYSGDTTFAPDTAVSVSTEAFNAICGSTDKEIAILSRVNGDYDTVVKASEGAGPTDYYPGKLVKQFDGYFIDLVSGKGNGGYSDCGDNQERALEESAKLQVILEKAFQAAKPLQ